MAEPTPLHPPLSAAKKIDIDGETFVDVAEIITMAREGDTPQCRALVRLFNAEYRAFAGSSLTDAKREEEAFGRAWQRMVRQFGVPPIASWDNPPPVPKS